MTKSEIRKSMKARRNELSETIRKEYDNDIRSKLIDLKDFRECDMLFTYVSFGSEVDTIAIIESAFKYNKKLFVPRVEANKGLNMNFYEIHSIDGLIRSKFGILEPDVRTHDKYVSTEKSTNPSDKRKLMLLPGLAFDKQGNRIGYGAGYYDRYLEANDDFIKIALAYDFQVMEHFATNRYDISADYIITPETVYTCKK